MKRIAVFVMILVLALYSFAIAEKAEEADYSYLDNMSIEELLDLEYAIQAKLSDNGVNAEDLMPQGVYVVGVDVKPGRYEFRAYTTGKNAYDQEKSLALNIYADEEAQKNYDWKDSHAFKKIGEPFSIELIEGDIIQVFYGGLYVTKPDSKSWSMD